MAKHDTYLFDRLRQAGLRKQVAKTLSGIGDGASKKALRAARGAVMELRSLADDLERRLPGDVPEAPAPTETVTPPSAPSTSAAPHAARSRTAAPTVRRAQRRINPRAVAPASPSASPVAAPISGARAARGQNKAKIMESLRTGPKTASEIAKDTGVGTGTVSTTLTKLAKSGELVKAERGYGLPG